MRKLLALSLLIPVLAACSGDGGTGPEEPSFVGTYSLQSVNGVPMPASFTDGTTTLTFSNGRFTLNADQTFSTSVTFTVTQPGSTFSQTVPSAGTFVRNNNAFRFRYNDGTADDTGSLTGSTLTLSSDGDTYVFKK